MPSGSQDSQRTEVPWWLQLIVVGVLIYLGIFHPDILLALIYIFTRSGGNGGYSNRRGGGGSSGGGGASGGW